MTCRQWWIINVYGLDERLRKEYKTIEQLEDKETKYVYKVTNIANPVCSETDRRGILADVLIKHGKMKFAEELYEKWIDRVVHTV